MGYRMLDNALAHILPDKSTRQISRMIPKSGLPRSHQEDRAHVRILPQLGGPLGDDGVAQARDGGAHSGACGSDGNVIARDSLATA
jgi:hypothetical protein